MSAPPINLQEWTDEELVDGSKIVRVSASLADLPDDYDQQGHLYFQVDSSNGTPYDGKIIMFEITKWKPIFMVPYYIDSETGDKGEHATIKYMTLSFDPHTQKTTAWLDMVEQKSRAET